MDSYLSQGYFSISESNELELNLNSVLTITFLITRAQATTYRTTTKAQLIFAGLIANCRKKQGNMFNNASSKITDLQK